MGRTQEKYIEIDDLEIVSNFGNWIMLMIFAKSVDRNEFINFISYVDNEEKNRETDEVPFDLNKLLNSINFLDTIILQLQMLDTELNEIYTEDRLNSILDSDQDFLYVFLEGRRNRFYSNQSNIKFLNELKELLNYSKKHQKPHMIGVM